MKYLSLEESNNLEKIREILAQQYQVVNLQECPNAFNTWAYELNKKYIVRFPRCAKSYQKLLKEQKVLRFLKNKITFAIPESDFIKTEYGFFIHKKIAGKTLSSSQYFRLLPDQQHKFCQDIAIFMFELHRLTEKIAKYMTLNRWERLESGPSPEEIRQFVREHPKFTLSQKIFIDDFCNRYKFHQDDAPLVFSSFDLMPKNIAFDTRKKEISGFYDFGDCGIGNLYYDFAQLALDCDIKIVRQVLEEYQKISSEKLDISRIDEDAFMLRLSNLTKHNSEEELKATKNYLRYYLRK